MECDWWNITALRQVSVVLPEGTLVSWRNNVSFKILYVAARADDATLVRQILRTDDYELIEARSASSGLTAALNVRPDLMLIDLDLPDMSGFELARQFQKLPQLTAVPTIALIPEGVSRLSPACPNSGFKHYLPGPISRFTLLEAIRQVRRERSLAEGVTHLTGSPIPDARRSVLIVEDNPALRAIFARTFDSRFFKVQATGDAMQALELLHQMLPEVILLDLDMPNMNRAGIVNAIRQHRQDNRQPQPKMIVVTGNCPVTRAAEAKSADLCLSKPIDIRELMTFAWQVLSLPVWTG